MRDRGEEILSLLLVYPRAELPTAQLILRAAKQRDFGGEGHVPVSSCTKGPSQCEAASTEGTPHIQTKINLRRRKKSFVSGSLKSCCAEGI